MRTYPQQPKVPGEPTVLLISIERNTRINDIAGALDAAWRAGIDEAAFVVRKTHGYSILFEQEVKTIRFPLTRSMGLFLEYGQDLSQLAEHDPPSPCGLLEVIRDEGLGHATRFELLAQAMVRCRQRFPSI